MKLTPCRALPKSACIPSCGKPAALDIQRLSAVWLNYQWNNN